MIHELKTTAPYWQRVADRVKTFEVRKADRDFQVGDDLRLREWIPSAAFPRSGSYTGGDLTARITYVYRGAGLAEGMCVLGISDVVVASWRSSDPAAEAAS